MRYRRLILPCIATVLLGFIIFKLQNRQLMTIKSAQDINNYIKLEQQQAMKIKLQKEIPSFGFSNLLADLSYLQFIQYFGDSEARKVTGNSLVTDYFETISERDSNFIYAHLFLSTANSLFAARPEKTVSLLEKIINSSADSLEYKHSLWIYKANDEILFLGDLEAARKSYLMAARQVSLRNDDIGNTLSQRFLATADFLKKNPDSTMTEIGAWASILKQTGDTKTQNYVINHLEQLGADVSVTQDGRFDVKIPEKLNRV